jgi:hypothetical protein
VILLEVTGLTILTSGFISTKIRCYLIKFLPQGGRQIAATNARASSETGWQIAAHITRFRQEEHRVGAEDNVQRKTALD